MTQGTTTSDQIWNGTVPAMKDSNILQLCKIVQRELRMMSVWIPPLPYVTAVTVVGFCLALFNTHEFTNSLCGLCFEG